MLWPTHAEKSRGFDIAKRLVITSGAKRGQHPSPATVMRMLREHGEQAATAAGA
jgi:hypothetical protein